MSWNERLRRRNKFTQADIIVVSQIDRRPLNLFSECNRIALIILSLDLLVLLGQAKSTYKHVWVGFLEAVNTPQMKSTRVDSSISPQRETNSHIQNSGSRVCFNP